MLYYLSYGWHYHQICYTNIGLEKNGYMIESESENDTDTGYDTTECNYKKHSSNGWLIVNHEGCLLNSWDLIDKGKSAKYEANTSEQSSFDGDWDNTVEEISLGNDWVIFDNVVHFETSVVHFTTGSHGISFKSWKQTITKVSVSNGKHVRKLFF